MYTNMRECVCVYVFPCACMRVCVHAHVSVPTCMHVCQHTEILVWCDNAVSQLKIMHCTHLK